MADLEKHLALNSNDVNAYVNRGIVSYNQGKNELALADFNQAIALNPNPLV